MMIMQQMATKVQVNEMATVAEVEDSLSGESKARIKCYNQIIQMLI